jgi:putative ABC transport system substrate-binding protein
MDRRRFLLTSLAGAFAVPLAAGAQQTGKVARIGLIGETVPTSSYLAGFGQGLRELGYVEGRNIVVEYRYAHGLLNRVPALVSELIRLDVSVLVVGGTISAQAAKRVTTTVPIVFVLAGDPVGSGLVASLARPGGNATGLSNLVTELSGKQLEIIKAAVPRASRVGVLYNPLSAANRSALEGARVAVRTLAMELQALEVRQPDQVASAVSAVATWRADALLALSDPVIGQELVQLSRLAADKRLPAMYARREFADVGGLLAYGPNFAENYRRAAAYVDRILKGANPADLPVQQPTEFELVINLRTARALGLTIPPSLLARADQVIE